MSMRRGSACNRPSATFVILFRPATSRRWDAPERVLTPKAGGSLRRHWPRPVLRGRSALRTNLDGRPTARPCLVRCPGLQLLGQDVKIAFQGVVAEGLWVGWEVGGLKVMHDQLVHLLAVPERSNVSIQD